MSRKDLFLLDKNAKLADKFQPIIQKMVKFTRVPGDTGIQNITGVGFKPTMVKFMAINTGTSEVSHGTDFASSRFVIYTDPNNWSASTSDSIYLQGASGSMKGEIVFMNADGISVVWSDAGTPAGTLIEIHAHCFK